MCWIMCFSSKLFKLTLEKFLENQFVTQDPILAVDSLHTLLFIITHAWKANLKLISFYSPAFLSFPAQQDVK